MRKLLALMLVATLLMGLVTGCSSDKDKAINKNSDRPRAGDPEGK
jgi:hypothetical protein